MRTFDTPDPISATVDLAIGHVKVSAGDGGDTLVEVKPSDESKADDVKAAERTHVEFGTGHLLVRAPKLRSWLSRRGGSIDVTIELPAGSNVHCTGGLVDVHADGRLEDCRIKTGLGHIRLEQTGKLSVKSGSGDISVDRATADAVVTVGAGEVRLRELDGSAVIKSSSGDTWVGVAGGNLRVGTANGSIAVDLARGSVSATTAKGDVRLGEVERGSVALETHVGDLEVGIGEGTSAWLDVSALAGNVHNALDAADAPEPAAETVEVRGRTSFGDVFIGRPVTTRP
jgi:hypothetical protein